MQAGIKRRAWGNAQHALACVRTNNPCARAFASCTRLHAKATPTMLLTHLHHPEGPAAQASAVLWAAPSVSLTGRQPGQLANAAWPSALASSQGVAQATARRNYPNAPARLLYPRKNPPSHVGSRWRCAAAALGWVPCVWMTTRSCDLASTQCLCKGCMWGARMRLPHLMAAARPPRVSGPQATSCCRAQAVAPGP